MVGGRIERRGRKERGRQKTSSPPTVPEMLFISLYSSPPFVVRSCRNTANY
jgi:hypothetical protein